ncbi:hypothetical protein KJZ99_09150 [bacterium]|nr:hypothetical protein [bacterium]
MMTKPKIFICLLILAVSSITACDDPRTPPVTAPNPAHTETILLWQNTASNGEIISAEFEVAAPLASINLPGVDRPARLTIAAYVLPDDDVEWYESIVSDSFPAYSTEIVRYLVGIETQQGVIDSVAGIRALCDSLPEECPSDTSGLLSAESQARSIQETFQDSLDIAIADTTELGDRRDSLGLVLDDRFTLALWMDGDTTTAYPDGLLLPDGRLSGQGIYLAETNSQSGFKGRGFQLDLAQFEAADLNNPGRPIEINWTTCFPGSQRPCLSVGQHTLSARATGAVTNITAAIVLVYAEDRP